jgi:inositol transporter-like SP family MFS transporter
LASRINSRHLTGWKATAAVAMSNYIDSGSIIAIAATLVFWRKAYFPANTGDMTSWLTSFSSNAFGAAIGAAIGGPLVDKYGRKFIYTYDLLVYALGGLIVVAAVNVEMLFAGFVIIGIAVGASVPAGWTYIAEFVPPERRARNVGATQLAWSFGPFIGFGIAIALEPLHLGGARIQFAWLVVVALVTWYIRQGLDESKRWETAKGGAQARPPRIFTSMRALFTRKANITALIFLGLVYMCWNQAASQNGIFLPTILGHMGYGTTDSDLFSMLSWAVVIVATLAFQLWADKISYRWFFVGGALLELVAWFILVYGSSTAASTAFLYTIIWGLGAGPSAQAFYSVWCPEMFATPYRAGAQGVMFFFVRAMSGGMSFLFPVILATHNGLMKDGWILIAFLIASLLIGAIWTPKTQGKSLDQIEIERYGEVVDVQELEREQQSVVA